jgi:O-antigen/teichoic acid export membrane protein
MARFRTASRRHGALIKNSAALTIGTGTAGALGAVYWWLAARSFSPEAIGSASAFISLMGFIGLLGECGIGTLLMGEIVQQRPEGRHGLISAAMVVALSISLAMGGVALVISRLVLNPSLIDCLVVFIGCGLMGLSAMVDKAFVGMLQAGLQMLRQFLFSALKLGLIAMAALCMPSDTGVLFSFVVSAGAALIIVEWFMRRTGQSLIHRPDFKLLYTLRRKAAHHYMLDMSAQAPLIIMPYLVAVLLSPATNAVFTVTWMVVLLAAIIPGALSAVVFTAVQAAPEQYRDKMSLSLGASLLFSLAFGCFIYLYAAEILTIFNPAYAAIGDSHMAFLGFGVIGHAIKSHVGAAARLNNRMRQASLIFGITSLFELACVTVGCRVDGLEGLSIGWSSALVFDGLVMCLITSPFRQSRQNC